MTRNALFALLIGTLVWGAEALAYHQGSGVAINGQVLSAQQLTALELLIGERVAPGDYVLDYASGCWANLTTGETGCPGGGEAGHAGGGSYTSRYGSGDRYANGDWSHQSDLAGGAVYGTGDGCYYAFGWSNC